MTTLSDFGVDIDNGDGQQPSSQTSQAFPRGRCITLITEGHSLRRCQNDAERGIDTCHLHDPEEELTIHSDPYELLYKDGRRAGNCRAQKADGNQCSYSTRITELVCTLHEPAEEATFVDLDDDAVHQEVVLPALVAVSDQFSADDLPDALEEQRA